MVKVKFQSRKSNKSCRKFNWNYFICIRRHKQINVHTQSIWYWNAKDLYLNMFAFLIQFAKFHLQSDYMTLIVYDLLNKFGFYVLMTLTFSLTLHPILLVLYYMCKMHVSKFHHFLLLKNSQFVFFCKFFFLVYWTECFKWMLHECFID